MIHISIMNLRISISLTDLLHMNVYYQYCIKYLCFKIEVIVDVFALKILIYQLKKQRRKKKEKQNSSSNDYRFDIF
jgi:hypothetical protein